MADGVSNVPKSLQNCCFMKLINDFETFPPESLALLPLRLRYELIRNLPAADVCQLEQSSFVEGLDMEEVWAAIVKKCGLVEAPNQSKDKFFAEVSKIIFNAKSSWERYSQFLLLLFTNDRQLQIERRGSGDFIFVRVQLPPRCQKELSHNHSLSNPENCIRLVLERTRYHPKILEIEDICWFYDHFLSTAKSPWLQGGENHQLLREYLSEVTCLTIGIRDRCFRIPYCRILEEMVKKALLFIMPILSKKRQLHLKELSIVDQAHFQRLLFTISPYLKIRKTKTPRKCIQPLESLSIIMNSSDDYYVPSDRYILELVEIIESQASLCRLELEIPGYISLGVSCRLCLALASLLKQPQFREMKVTMQMPSRGFQEIIHSFIATPRSSDCSLHLRGEVKDYGPSLKVLRSFSSSAGNLSCLSPPQENILHKTLILNIDPPNTVLQWLHEYVVLRLKELRVQEYSMSLTLSFLLSHPQIEVETLSVTFSHGILPDQSFDHLLQNVHLKHISLDTLNFDDHEIDTFDISSLIRGLYKQAHLGTLETLKIRVAGSYDEDDISQLFEADGSYGDDDITQLFEAIVSLPQLENFTLDIDFRDFTDEHVAILCKVWKNTAGGKKFKKLHFSSFHNLDLSILEDVTQELVKPS